MRAEPHINQAARLAALRGLEILDTPREESFDKIVELAAFVCEAPISVITLIDEHRQWFKAETGLGVRETPLEHSICAHVILQPGLTVIPDTLEDDRFKDNPLCGSQMNLRFYAGALLETEDGLPIGTLCVLDTKPRQLNDMQKKTLSVLAEQVMAQIRLRREVGRTSFMLKEVDHRVKNSLALIGSMLRMQSQLSSSIEVEEALKLARDRVMAVAALHDQLHASGSFHDVNLKAFLERVISSLESQTREGVQIETDIDAVDIVAKDAINIGIILNELVTNALKHAFSEHQKGVISVSAHVADNQVLLSVKDSGCGLPEGFEPKKARGLGMRLAYSIARQYQNELKWQSDASGTLFECSFPLKEEL